MKINDINFSTIKSFGKSHLESEKLVSQLFNKKIYPPNYSVLISNLSSLPVIYLNGETSWNIDFETLHSELFNKNDINFMIEKKVQSFFEGKESKIQRIIENIYFKSEIYFSEISNLFVAKENADFKRSYDILSIVDISEMGKIIDNGAPEATNIPEIIYSMKEISEKSSYILEIVSNNNEFYTQTIKIPDVIDELKIFLIDAFNFVSNMENQSPDYTTILATCISSIQSLIPPDDFDPMKEDVLHEFMNILKNPMSFYKKSKSGEISSPEVGSHFYECFPEYFRLNMEKFLTSYDHMDFNKQEITRNSFGV